MNTGESLIESITRSTLSMEKVIELALVDMNANIINAQIETEKYPIEDLEKMSTTELVALIGTLRIRLHKIQSYIENVARSRKEISISSVRENMYVSSTIVNMLLVFEEILMTHIELGTLQKTCDNISRILSKRNNQN